MAFGGRPWRKEKRLHEDRELVCGNISNVQLCINPNQRYVLLRIHVFSSHWVYAKKVKRNMCYEIE